MLGIMAVVALVVVFVFMVDWTDMKTKLGISQQADWRTELSSVLEKTNKQEDKKITETLWNFADKIDQCQNFGKQAVLLDFKLVDMSVEYKGFDAGYIKDGVYHSSDIKSEVAVYRDNDVWAGKINEYEVDLKGYAIGENYEVVSMRRIDDANIDHNTLSPEEAARIRNEEKAFYTINIVHPGEDLSEDIVRERVEYSVRRCLSGLIKDFDRIDNSYTFTHAVEDVSVGNADNNPMYASQNHRLRWQGDNYTDRAGFTPATLPFLEVVVTNAGHLLSYESNLSFFRYSTLRAIAPATENSIE